MANELLYTAPVVPPVRGLPMKECDTILHCPISDSLFAIAPYLRSGDMQQLRLARKSILKASYTEEVSRYLPILVRENSTLEAVIYPGTYDEPCDFNRFSNFQAPHMKIVGRQCDAYDRLTHELSKSIEVEDKGRVNEVDEGRIYMEKMEKRGVTEFDLAALSLQRLTLSNVKKVIPPLKCPRELFFDEYCEGEVIARILAEDTHGLRRLTIERTRYRTEPVMPTIDLSNLTLDYLSMKFWNAYEFILPSQGPEETVFDAVPLELLLPFLNSGPERTNNMRKLSLDCVVGERDARGVHSHPEFQLDVAHLPLEYLKYKVGMDFIPPEGLMEYSTVLIRPEDVSRFSPHLKALTMYRGRFEPFMGNRAGGDASLDLSAFLLDSLHVGQLQIGRGAKLGFIPPPRCPRILTMLDADGDNVEQMLTLDTTDLRRLTFGYLYGADKGPTHDLSGLALDELKMIQFPDGQQIRPPLICPPSIHFEHIDGVLIEEFLKIGTEGLRRLVINNKRWLGKNPYPAGPAKQPVLELGPLQLNYLELAYPRFHFPSTCPEEVLFMKVEPGLIEEGLRTTDAGALRRLTVEYDLGTGAADPEYLEEEYFTWKDHGSHVVDLTRLTLDYLRLECLNFLPPARAPPVVKLIHCDFRSSWPLEGHEGVRWLSAPEYDRSGLKKLSLQRQWLGEGEYSVAWDLSSLVLDELTISNVGDFIKPTVPPHFSSIWCGED